MEVLDAIMIMRLGWVQIQANISGLVATHKEPEANHVWRMIRRSDLQSFGLTDNAIINENHAWKELPPDPMDAILLLKRHMHSTELSQDPVLLIPAAVARTLKEEDLKVPPARAFGEDAIMEYRQNS